MSVRTITRVWDHSKQSSTDLLLLLAIADHADDDGVCWPGIARLAQKTRTSERQTIRNIEKLAKSGEVFLSRQCGRGNSNLYFITVGLTPDEVTQVLISRFDMPEDKAQITLESIIKGDTGDRVLSEKKVTSGTIKGDIQRKKVTPVTLKGDIAMSPEPLEPSIEPSINKERKKQRPSVIPAIQIFVEETGKYCLTNPQIKAIERRVGLDPPRLEQWRLVVNTWIMRGYKPTNAEGMLSWLDNGIPTYKNGTGATNGHSKQNNGSGYTTSTDPDRIPTVNPFANSG